MEESHLHRAFVDMSTWSLCNILMTGPWGTLLPFWRPLNLGGETAGRMHLEDHYANMHWWSGWRTQLRTDGVWPQHWVISVLGDLSWFCLTFSNRKGWLSEIRISHSSQNTTKHKHLRILGCWRPFPTDLLTQACSAGEKGWGQVRGNMQLLGGGELISREGLHQFATQWSSSDHGCAHPQPP